MERYYILEGSFPVEVLHTGVVSIRQAKSGEIQRVKVRRRNEVMEVDRDDLIIVREYDGPATSARVILSTDDDLSGFFFYVPLHAVKGMTLAEQSDYVALAARRELVKVFLQCGLKGLIKSNEQLKTLHLHKSLEGLTDNYACDHKHHDTETEEKPSTAMLLLNALTEFPEEDARKSLQRVRSYLRTLSNKEKQAALDAFLESESEEIKTRVHQAEVTEDGRDEYLIKFTIVQYLKYARTLPVEHDIKDPSILSDLWMLEWQYRNIRIALLPKNN
jgi:hypothetical protein